MTFARQDAIFMFGQILKRIKQKPEASIASSLFLVSFFLPAYTITDGNFTGFECFEICLRIAGNISLEGSYYLGLALVNFVFAALVSVYFTKESIQMHVKISSLACTLYIFSWAIINIFHEKLSVMDVLGIGYYLWFLAFIILSIMLLRSKPHPI